MQETYFTQTGHPQPPPLTRGQIKRGTCPNLQQQRWWLKLFSNCRKICVLFSSSLQEKRFFKGRDKPEKITYHGPEQGFQWSAAGMHCYWETWKQAELDVLLQHINTWPEELAIPNNSSWNVIQTAWSTWSRWLPSTDSKPDPLLWLGTAECVDLKAEQKAQTTVQGCLGCHPELPCLFLRYWWGKGREETACGNLALTLNGALGKAWAQNCRENVQLFYPYLLYFSLALLMVSKLVSPSS